MKPIRRREFVVGGTAAVLSLGATCSGGEARLEADRAGFGELLGEEFRIFDEEGNVVYAQLQAIFDGPTIPDRNEYILELQSGPADFLEAGTYEFYHERMRAFHAHMDPSRTEAEGPVYSIVFNQFR